MTYVEEIRAFQQLLASVDPAEFSSEDRAWLDALATRMARLLIDENPAQDLLTVAPRIAGAQSVRCIVTEKLRSAQNAHCGASSR